MKWTSRAIHEVSIPRPQHVVAFKVFSPTDYSKRFLDRVSAVTAYNDMVLYAYRDTPWKRPGELTKFVVQYDQEHLERLTAEIDTGEQQNRNSIQEQNFPDDDETESQSSCSTEPENSFNITAVEDEQRKASKKRRRVPESIDLNSSSPRSSPRSIPGWSASGPAENISATQAVSNLHHSTNTAEIGATLPSSSDRNACQLAVDIPLDTGPHTTQEAWMIRSSAVNNNDDSHAERNMPTSSSLSHLRPYDVAPPGLQDIRGYQHTASTPRGITPVTTPVAQYYETRSQSQPRPVLPNRFVASNSSIDESKCVVSFIQVASNGHISEWGVCTTTGIATPSMIRQIGKRALEFETVSFLIKKVAQGVSFMDLRVLYSHDFLQLSPNDWHYFLGGSRPVVCIPVLDGGWWGLVTVIFVHQRVVVLYLDCRMPDESHLIRSKIHQYFINAYTPPPGTPSTAPRARVTLELVSPNQQPDVMSEADSGSNFAAIVRAMMYADDLSDIENLITSVNCPQLSLANSLSTKLGMHGAIAWRAGRVGRRTLLMCGGHACD